MTTSFEIPRELEERARPFLSGTQTFSQFARSAFEEKVNRMEMRDKRARMQVLERDTKMLEPIISEVIRKMIKHGELNI